VEQADKDIEWSQQTVKTTLSGKNDTQKRRNRNCEWTLEIFYTTGHQPLKEWTNCQNKSKSRMRDPPKVRMKQKKMEIHRISVKQHFTHVKEERKSLNWKPVSEYLNLYTADKGHLSRGRHSVFIWKWDTVHNNMICWPHKGQLKHVRSEFLVNIRSCTTQSSAHTE
jgi:hypothetical protein